MEYKLNGEVVGSGLTLQLNGSGITATELNDGIIFDIPSGGGGGITELVGDVTAGPGSGGQSANVAGFYGVPLDASTMAVPNTDNIIQFDGTNWKAIAPNFASKSLTSAHIYVGNGLGDATNVALSGDGSLSNTGALSITDLTITGEATGDILYFNGTNWVKLGIGTAGQVLTVNGGATAPVWA